MRNLSVTRNYHPTFSLRLHLLGPGPRTLDSDSQESHPILGTMISFASIKPQRKASIKLAWSIDQMPDLDGKVVVVTGGSSGVSPCTHTPTHHSLISFGRCGERHMQAASLEERKGLHSRQVTRQCDCSHRRDGHRNWG